VGQPAGKVSRARQTTVPSFRPGELDSQPGGDRDSRSSHSEGPVSRQSVQPAGIGRSTRASRDRQVHSDQLRVPARRNSRAGRVSQPVHPGQTGKPDQTCQPPGPCELAGRTSRASRLHQNSGPTGQPAEQPVPPGSSDQARWNRKPGHRANRPSQVVQQDGPNGQEGQGSGRCRSGQPAGPARSAGLAGRTGRARRQVEPGKVA
jgi:hypothetical protein